IIIRHSAASTDGRLLIVSLPAQKEIERHAKTDQDDEKTHPALVDLAGIISTAIAADDGTNYHEDCLRPHHCSRDNESNHSDTVDTCLEERFDCVHLVDILHAHHPQGCQHQNADPTSEIATIDGDDDLKERHNEECKPRDILLARYVFAQQASDRLTEGEEQRSQQQEIGYEQSKCRLWRSQQEYRTEHTSNQAGDTEHEQHYAILLSQFFAICTHAGNGSGPEGHGIGCIGIDRRHACEDKRGKANETTTPGNRVQGAAKNGCNEEQASLKKCHDTVPWLRQSLVPTM